MWAWPEVASHPRETGDLMISTTPDPAEAAAPVPFHPQSSTSEWELMVIAERG